MPKAMFTQGMCVLMDSAPSLDEVASVLSEFSILKRVEEVQEWALSGPSLILDYLTDQNGLVAVDVVDRPWPDHMGSPQDESMLFGAWSMGHFGPFTYPGGLGRAAQQSWTWEPGKKIAEEHQAFLRVRLSYAFGAEDDAPILPDEYEAYPELDFMTRVVEALLGLPNALCYFNPNGEVLMDQQGFSESLQFGAEHDLPPFDAWCNARLFIVNSKWSMMDVVGNGQLDIPDVEACFFADGYDFDEVANFLRNVSMYVLHHGEVINDGDTMDGPGGIHWQCHQHESGICDPPRPVLRWFPVDDHEAPPELAS